MGTLFSLLNVELCLGNRFKLDIPQLILQPKNIYIFVGPNGAGKSTLLRLLALLSKPTQGEIWFKGENLSRCSNYQLSVFRLQLTLVEQSPYLFRGTVYYNLAYGLQIRGVCGTEQEQRISNALKTFGLSGFEQRNAQGLSGGEAQRVALARALVIEPDVLILDEPTANIDQKSLADIEAGISSLPQQGVTVIMTTHDSDQPRRLEGTVIPICAGRLTALPQADLAKYG